MRKKILIRGPVLSRSGYGEQARFAMRSIREYEDRFDIFILPVGWGQLSWTWEDNEERKWVDGIIRKTTIYEEQTKNVPGNQKYDISLQITIPNEWDRTLAAYNVGYTAGIETDRVAPIWIQKCYEMDKIIVVSNHAKEVFEKTSYKSLDDQGNWQGIMGFNDLDPNCPEITVVNYPVREVEAKKFEHKFPTKFNFLTMAQWGTRKNLEATIGWFIEEFKDNEDVGLIVKTSVKGTSTIDREFTKEKLSMLLKSETLVDRKCKIYLVHGDLTEEELNGLYQHHSVKALINLAHGEGFGLPMFEAVYNKVPVVAMGWSGHLDFLLAPDKKKKGKGKKTKKEMVPYFAKVNHQLGQVQPAAVWDGVIVDHAMWAYPVEKSYKIVLRDVYDNYKKYKKTATDLDKYVRSKFTSKNQYKQFADAVHVEEEFDVEDWLESLGEEVFE